MYKVTQQEGGSRAREFKSTSVGPEAIHLIPSQASPQGREDPEDSGISAPAGGGAEKGVGGISPC